MDRTSLIGLLGLTLAGGILGSVGVGALIRSKRVRAVIVRRKWWGIALYFLAVGGGLVGIVAWSFSWVLRSPSPGDSRIVPALFFGFGLAAGLTFTLSPVYLIWRGGRQMKDGSRKRRGKSASRQERLAFARKLAAQISEFSPDLRDVEVTTKGDDGTTLAIRGGLAREQAEKLVNVLRGDLEDLGIRRVESADGGRSWWVRV
jgi:uncharacterized membrane protein YedE/YeeE